MENTTNTIWPDQARKERGKGREGGEEREAFLLD